MGSDPRGAYPPDADEAPRHDVAVPAFRLGRVAVTNAQYGAFVAATGHPPPSSWPQGTVPAGVEEVPVTYVTWHDARAFCAWAGGRLPTEAEWEAAATGGKERLWPWGDQPPAADHAVFGTGIGGPSPAGAAQAGAAACGALDMAGNVWEWVSSAYRPYPYDAADGREDEGAAQPRAVRGGSYIHDPAALRCTARHALLPAAADPYVGFRIASAAGEGAPEIDWVEVPGGTVAIGRDPAPFRGEARTDEYPPHTVELEAFEISETPVTNAQYAAFTEATGHRRPPHWLAGAPPAETGNEPVTWVDWNDASAYSAWVGGRLPTEAEWEKAARGDDGRLFPWGDTHPTPGRASFGAGPKDGHTSPVTARPTGASPYGVLDMAGNVWEWVASAYWPYPYRADDGREDPAAPAERALRGGSYASALPGHLRCAARSRSYPGRRAAHVGFRVARDLP